MLRTGALRAWAAAAALLAGACGDRGGAPAVRGPPPNVLLYVTDTVRADSLGAYGNPVIDTPAIDRLAAEGTLYENAYAQSSWTRPSIASMLTGLYPDVHGVETRRDRAPERLSFLSEHFQRHGYATAAITSNANVGSFFGFDQGYGDFFELYPRKEIRRLRPEDAARSDRITRRAIEWIDAAPEPFFLFILTTDPHWPYQPPPGFDRYGGDYRGSVDGEGDVGRGADLSEDDRARIRSYYYGEIAFNDHSLGELMDHLRARGIADRTLVLFTSDHGEEFWEHGGSGHGKTLYQESIRIPLILRDPASGAPGARVAARVRSVDIFPTLLERAHLPVPSGIDGRSIAALGEDEPRELYASLDLDGRRVKSLVLFPWEILWFQKTGRRALVDLRADPQERRNLMELRPVQGETLFRRLRSKVRAHQSRRARLGARAPARPIPVGELPAATREALEALGYAAGEPGD